MSDRKKSVTRQADEEGEELISRLPEPILSFILSFLPTEEAARASILSKRWTQAWRYVSRLNINQSRLMRDQTYLISMLSNKDRIDNETIRTILENEIRNIIGIINSILNSHRGELCSFHMLHFPKFLENGILDVWIRFLVEIKGIKDLGLLCTDMAGLMKKLHTEKGMVTLSLPLKLVSSLFKLVLSSYKLEIVPSPSESYTKNLETLKLARVFIGDENLEIILSTCESLKNLSLIGCLGFEKFNIDHPNIRFLELQDLFLNEIHITAVNLGVIFLQTIGCQSSKEIVIDIPSLKVFSSHCIESISSSHTHELLETKVILEDCSDLLRSELPRQNLNIFENLSALMVDLKLNKVRDAMALAYVLRTCLYLEKLEVTILQSDDDDDTTEDCCLPYPNILFWEKREYYDCVTHKLEFVCIIGFSGQVQEMEFAKHLITRGTKIKKLTIFFDDKCSFEGENTGLSLLSVPRASLDICIEFKPGKERASRKAGDPDDWILNNLPSLL
ncbi:F-box domain-containing protein/FBD domain-containing protein [Quillaja saponaria]|uniref:F-box domain-containing protein/FBD domain-containing protein n=1 Tax=Quillaja saponaria TaxID=32244 RepID=A0AAD7PBM4_QUISA|nr:F-box domain-containing protein/FBD domain-containing protein [Quillaja saponaria]